MSSWKLVEAVAEDSPAKPAQDNNAGRGGFQSNYAGRGSGRGSGRGVGSGRGASTGRSNGGRGSVGGNTGRGNNYYANSLSQADRNYLSHMSVQQIELIFNLDNLCMDTFVRAYMDEAGYVPLALLCSYQNVVCFGALYLDVVEKLKELPAESKIELDASNETVRLKTGWENWLMPNASTGGRGVPRYVKQTEAQLAEAQAAYDLQMAAAYEAQGGMDGFEAAQYNNNYSNGNSESNNNETVVAEEAAATVAEVAVVAPAAEVL